LIRRAVVADAPNLVRLMQRLAKFEGYADRFAVKESDLIERGLAANGDAQFTAWVKESNGVLLGYALMYVIPFTFDLRPTVVLKELFVDDAVRSRGVGQELFGAVVQYAQTIDARLLRWQVLPGNEPAKHFYRDRDGCADVEWESWVRDLDRG
jgi:GNAT superfamily N-acetyltransferase